MSHRVKRNSLKEEVTRLEEYVRRYKKACLYVEFYDKKVFVINDKSDEDKLQDF